MTLDVDFQAAASQQGRAFEDATVTLLRMSGWTIIERHHRTDNGVEIDIVADDVNERRWWIECKGSWLRMATAGARRDDTVKKAIAVAWYVKRNAACPPYMLIASHLPNEGTLPARMLAAALADGLFDHVTSFGTLSSPVDEDDE